MSGHDVSVYASFRSSKKLKSSKKVLNLLMSQIKLEGGNLGHLQT